MDGREQTRHPFSSVLGAVSLNSSELESQFVTVALAAQSASVSRTLLPTPYLDQGKQEREPVFQGLRRLSTLYSFQPQTWK